MPPLAAIIMKIRLLTQCFYLFVVSLQLLNCKPKPSTNENKLTIDSTEHKLEPKSPISEDNFGDIKNISAYSNTIFVATLENKIVAEKNVIYSPTILFCWAKIRSLLKYPIYTMPNSTEDLNLLNNSRSYVNSLRKEDYSDDASLRDGALFVHSYFHKDLPFQIPFNNLGYSLLFKNEKVNSFGLNNSDNLAYSQIYIPYYKDDDHFILILRPKDETHQIILSKGIELEKSLIETVKEIYRLSSIDSSKNQKFGQTFYFDNKLDTLKIPVLRFNIETRFATLENQTIISNHLQFPISEVYQRNAFLLNEKGAIAESEGEVKSMADTAESAKPKPRRFVFDKPFFIILKTREYKNPYFVMKVNDTELMEKN